MCASSAIPVFSETRHSTLLFILELKHMPVFNTSVNTLIIVGPFNFQLVIGYSRHHVSSFFRFHRDNFEAVVYFVPVFSLTTFCTKHCTASIVILLLFLSLY